MNGSKLRYILGGAVMGAIIGAVYANFIYDMVQRGKEPLSILTSPNHTEEWESERTASASTQRKAEETREVTDSE